MQGPRRRSRRVDYLAFGRVIDVLPMAKMDLGFTADITERNTTAMRCHRSPSLPRILLQMLLLWGLGSIERQLNHW
jgi:hypothetical protein